MIIKINGAKNSSLAILACCLLTKGEYKISNVPKIKDIYNLLDLIKQFNVNITWNKKDLTINTEELSLPKKMNYGENFRASYYLIGSTCNMITNNFIYEVSKGCEIGERPINYHIDFIEKMGYQVVKNKTQVSIYYNKNVEKCEEIYFKIKKKSVGCTINGIILSVKSNKIVYLEEYSKEPYIYDTINFLIKMGANIEITEKYIKIIGKKILNSCNYEIMYDPIETGTYIILAAILNYKKLYHNLIIGPIIKSNLGKFNILLKKIGFIFVPNKDKENYYTIIFNRSITNTFENLKIETGYYPEIYTDLQPLIVLLLSELEICSSLKENVWEDRYKYIKDLNRMGHLITKKNDILFIREKKEYVKINKLNCYDLRADAALLLASLFSNNYHETIIDFKFIDRGYFNLNTNIKNIYNMINKND